MYDNLIAEFYRKMNHVSLNALGVIDAQGLIHTLGTDSKIIGRIFEMLTQPVLKSIADSHCLSLETPSSQTTYPDFILLRGQNDPQKIAIDVKSTYISGNSIIKFTLGSFASYMRNGTKNIQYNYTDYAKHYVIGFIYERNGEAQASYTYNYEQRNCIPIPYRNIRYFMQEKYKIAGDKPGSGNTENIGSFPTKKFEDLVNGEGPFSKLGPDIFDLYWKYYPKYRNLQKPYTSLPQFLEWLPQNIDKLTLLRPFDKSKILECAKKYNF